MGDVSVTLSLDQLIFTRNQLQQGIFLKYDISGGSLTGNYLICFAKHGSDPDMNVNFPFTPTSGSGAIKLSPMSPYWDKIPWSTWPPRENIYYWDILLVRKDGSTSTVVAKATLVAEGYPPEITLANYDKNILSLSWTNPGSYTDFIVQLFDTSGSMHYNQPATGTSASISKILDQDKTYKVVVSALIGGEPGPQSSEVTLIVVPPVISLLQYTLTNGNGKLDVSWGAVTGAEMYITTVYSSDGSFKQNIPSKTTSCTLESTLDQARQYKATVSATADNGIVIGPLSAELSAIIKAPVISLLQYKLTNGNGKLDTSWGAVTGAEMYITTVYSTDGSFKQNIPSTTTSSTLESTLDQARQYKTTVCAAADNGIVIGPASDGLDAIIASPGNVNLNYNGQNLSSVWIIPESLQGKQFSCELYKNSAKLDGQVTGSDHALFNYTLDAGAIYTSHVRGESGVVKGPWTKPAQGPYAESIIYNYDSVSRLKSAIFHNTITVTYTMDNPGNILSIQNNPDLEK